MIHQVCKVDENSRLRPPEYKIKVACWVNITDSQYFDIESGIYRGFKNIDNLLPKDYTRSVKWSTGLNQDSDIHRK